MNVDSLAGQVAIGNHIQQRQQVQPAAEISEADRAVIYQLLATLRGDVAAAAPPEQQGAALERLEELETAIAAENPDITTMAYVRQWFVKNLPTFSGAVTSVIVHPIVGKIVEAAGEIASSEFRRQFQKP